MLHYFEVTIEPTGFRVGDNEPRWLVTVYRKDDDGSERKISKVIETETAAFWYAEAAVEERGQ